ncbi:MAG: hypothetical protein AAGA23_13760 [Pseudomonadota bacterium]
MRKITRYGVVLAVAVMSGCGLLPKQSDYDTVDAGQSLEVPPELDRPDQSTAPRIPNASYSAVSGANVSPEQNPLDSLEGVALVEFEGSQVLALKDSPESAFRRLGLALDRIGVAVENSDPTESSYEIAYVDQVAKDERPGVLSRWFLRKKGPTDHSGTYLLSVTPHNNDVSLIKLVAPDGRPAADRVKDDVLVPLRDRLG